MGIQDVDSKKLTARSRVRLTPEEYLAMKEFAASQQRSLSNWMRHVLVGELRRRGKKLDSDVI